MGFPAKALGLRAQPLGLVLNLVVKLGADPRLVSAPQGKHNSPHVLRRSIPWTRLRTAALARKRRSCDHSAVRTADRKMSLSHKEGRVASRP